MDSSDDGEDAEEVGEVKGKTRAKVGRGEEEDFKGEESSEEAESSESEQEEKKEVMKKSVAAKADSKKRGRDGNPKKAPAPKAAVSGKDPKKGAGPKAPEKGGPGVKPGKPAEEKKMMSQKEAYEAIKDYMIKVGEICFNNL